jgi:hypothetical protein
MGPSRSHVRRWVASLSIVTLLGTGCSRGPDESRRPADESPHDDARRHPDERNPARAKVHIELGSSGDTEFTTASGENRIHLRAQLPAGFETAEVVWQVEQGIGDSWTPVSVPVGGETAISVATPTGTTRYQGSHPNTAQLRAAQLKRERIHYRVSAVARLGGRSLPSDTLQIEQATLAAIRQEYLDLGLRRGAPPLAWFKQIAQLPVGLLYGDFDVAVVEPHFMERLARLEEVWKKDYGLRWQINSIFRNPVHNRFHVVGGGSGPISNSWHQFGCAADLQTYPLLGGGRATQQDSVNARQFWDALSQEAIELEFQVEPRDKNPARPGASYSGIGHVHLETDCIQ